jgi:hypothetical protein
MRILILLFVFLSFSRAFAQSTKYLNSAAYRMNRNTIDEFREDKEIEGGFITTKSLKYSEIKGNPYLREEFSDGTIWMSDGSVVENCSLRYNMFSDLMEYMLEGVVYEVTPKSKVKKAKFDGHTFACFNFSEKRKPGEQYFEILAEGKVTLLKKYSLKFIPPAPASPYSDEQMAHFGKPEASFYISDNQGDILLVKNEKTLLKILENKKSAMSLYISDNHLSVLAESDLLKIIDHYNSFR